MEFQLSEESKNRLSSHVADERGVDAMFQIRKAARDFAKQIEMLVPAGRDRATAITLVQQAMMMANAGISSEFPINAKEV